MADPARVAELFCEAMDLAAEERRAFLERACGDDTLLRSEVESLLDADDRAESFLEPAPPDDDRPDPNVGTRVGPWQLTRLLGSGGMGSVYLAERADGAFEKRVAVKLIRAGLGTKKILQRFAQERRVLAGLEHPNIAALIDGGATDDGRPYLVMEFVEGAPIDRYCDDRELSLRERLRLIRGVCSAVQHAHRNLIVHRDIKPSNILVTGGGAVKLLDFGIAKVLGDPRDTSLTDSGARAMTPRYASPEQIRHRGVTTATDVYSLGVVLFELLSGGRPYDSAHRSLPELEQAVTDRTPTRPSAAVAGSAIARREGGASALARKLSGDLDNIILTAIRKEPERRYGSVEQLSADIRRHLDGFPVTARPDTFSYRASKFVARNRSMVVTAAAAAGALILATGVSIHFALQEAEQRSVADARFEDVRELANTFLTEVDGAIASQGKTAAREKIVSTGLAYLDELAAEARDDPRILRDVARGYFRVARIQGDPKSPSLGDASAALESARKGQQAAALLAEADPVGLESRLVEVEAQILAGDLSRHLASRGDVIEHFEAALAARIRIGETVPDSDLAEPRLDTVHFRLAYALERLEESEPAIEHFLRAHEIGERLIEEHPDEPRLFQSLAITLTALSQAYRFAGQPEKSLELLPPIRERLSAEADRHPQLRPALANLRYNLGWAYVDQGEIARGIDEIAFVTSFYRELAEADPDDVTALRNTASGLHDLGELEDVNGRTEVGLAHYEEMLGLRRSILSRSPDSAVFRANLAGALSATGDLLVKLGRPREALERQREAVEILSALAVENPEPDRQTDAATARQRAVEIESLLHSDASRPAGRQ